MAGRIKRKKTRKQDDTTTSKARPFLIWGAVVVGIIALAALLFLSMRGPTPIADLMNFYGQERGHDNTVIYASDLPPVGGLHSEVWQNCGIYDEPIDAANAVHSMEHGAVWITYQPDLPQEEIATLQNLGRNENYLLLSPYPNLKSPVVLSAWGVQLEVDTVNDKRIKEFIKQYQQGPTTPERGASCRDGVGSPLQ
ncbi:MAG: DUF3105 domain-containing protein [Anaerolineales bacterium]|nr:DUF3105 domain-containing protein [Anaerolineales bacterium]